MVLSVVFILLCTALSVGLFIVIRRHFAPPGGYYHDAEVASGVFGVVGTGYAVVIGFVIFSVFGSYDAARINVGQEAVSMRQLASTASYFDAADTQLLRGELICYGRAVVNDEWPSMQEARESTLVTGWVSRLDGTTQAMNVESAKKSAALQNWFQQSRDRQEGRRGRIAESSPFVPTFVWVLLVVLFAVVLFYQCLFAEPRRPLFAQAVGVAAMAITLVSALALVWMLDRPFNDRGAMLSSTRIQTVVLDMEQAYGFPAATIPCTPQGQPAT